METLWPFFGSTVGLATLGAALAVPAARRLTLGSVQDDWLCNELELDHIQADGQTIACKSGTLMRVISLMGESYETKPFEEQVALCAGRQQMLNQIGEIGAVVRWFGAKRERAIVHQATWPGPVLEDIGQAEAALFRRSYSIHWYLMLSARSAHTLDKAMARALPLLSPYRAEVLTVAADGEACPLTAFANYLVSGEVSHDLPRLSRNLSGALPAADPQFRADGGICMSVPTPLHQRILVVRGWPETVDGWPMGQLMALPGELDLTQVCLPERQEIASPMLLHKLKGLQSNPFSSSAATADFAAAADIVGGGEIWWRTQFHITLRHPTQAGLDELTRQASDILSRRRILYSVETKGAAVAWFNRLPEHNTLLRPLRLFSDAIAALWPLPFSPVGRHACPWGQGPVRQFFTGTRQAYAFQFHISDRPQSLGNFLVFAPSGSGKSTVIAHLLAGLTRHAGVLSLILDSKEGTRFMVEAFGGLYQNFDSLALNPLAVAEDSRQGRQRLYLLLRSMLGEVADAPESGPILDHLIATALQLPPHQRSLSALFEPCVPAQTRQRGALADWVVDGKGKAGRYSHVFNAAKDSLASLLGQAPMVGINMNEALEDARLAPPVVAHILETITASRHKGFAVFIDEAANLLRNGVFADYVRVLYREVRKQDGIVGMAFQDPAALHRSGIAEAALENTATLIFFPNTMGRKADYEVFNLNDEQKQFIFHSPPGSGRRVLVVRRDAASGYEESVILDVDLSQLADGDCLKYFRSGPEAVQRMVDLQTQWGSAWAAHL
ncbi:VirB4 family type IV secretion system protein [Insolitispirillum peregrinum]|uniref:Type IV secretion system protein VirB4 n=1 Tax=Insolitispirillum peregrinum TaxID=80876 RepID=A0A1N7MHY7_9PROT|nr:VirB4 family type IV secretion system protein [Insolitispirillum peregrinum]SIS85529.1 type IV secretion system protein VirB4 [Insolitispirillum peregrinum]